MRGSATPPPEAADQLGVFTAAQAAAAGYSAYRIRRLLRDRRWVVVLGSVYVETSTALTHASLARAGLLAAGTGSVVSHSTAARLHGLMCPVDPEVHLTVPPAVHLRIPGLRTHRVPLPENQLQLVDGVLCTDLQRTLVDCLLWMPEEAGRSLALDALRQRRVSAEQLRSALLATGQRHGLSRAWRVLGDVSQGAHSEAEVRAHRLLSKAGFRRWRANVAIEDDRGLIGFADVVFDDVPLILEFDGRAFHSAEDRFQRDRARQNRLVMAGYTVLRFTWSDIVDRPDEVVAQVRGARESLLRAAGRARPSA